jgi:RNA polymerase sigma-70 factor (sigma-E family)
MVSNREEYSAFYGAEFPAIARSVFLLTRDREAADDITQEAFVQLYVHWRKVATYERPGAWVRRVAIRLAVKRLRREESRGRVEAAADSRSESTPAPVDADIVTAVAQLPTRQRVAVVLYYFEDRPVAEIGEVLGISESNAKTTLFRARRRLAELLGEEVPQDA